MQVIFLGMVKGPTPLGTLPIQEPYVTLMENTFFRGVRVRVFFIFTMRDVDGGVEDMIIQI